MEADAVVWTVHPAGRRRVAAVATLAVIALAGLAAVEVGGGIGWGVVAVVFLVLAVSPFLWPTRYRMDEGGIEVRHMGGVRRRAWATVRRVERVPGGVLVSPYRQASFRDRVRGIVLRVDGDPSSVLARARALARLP
jgi:hypothetical protein